MRAGIQPRGQQGDLADVVLVLATTPPVSIRRSGGRASDDANGPVDTGARIRRPCFYSSEDERPFQREGGAMRARALLVWLPVLLRRPWAAIVSATSIGLEVLLIGWCRIHEAQRITNRIELLELPLFAFDAMV
jgi:hypothetical protein